MSVSPVSFSSRGVVSHANDESGSSGAARGPRTTLVLGGARSGKSRFAEELVATLAGAAEPAAGRPATAPVGRTHAESLVEESGASVPIASRITYIATSAVVSGDAAFAERIALHRARRPAAWGLIEADHDLAGALRRADTGADAIVMIDCLTLWLTRLLCPMDSDAPRADWQERLADFHDGLIRSQCRIVLVSNEIGLGVVPLGAITRLFVDEMGRLNQRVAAACDRVVLTVAGLPLEVKPFVARSLAADR